MHSFIDSLIDTIRRSKMTFRDDSLIVPHQSNDKESNWSFQYITKGASGYIFKALHHNNMLSGTPTVFWKISGTHQRTTVSARRSHLTLCIKVVPERKLDDGITTESKIHQKINRLHRSLITPHFRIYYGDVYQKGFIVNNHPHYINDLVTRHQNQQIKGKSTSIISEWLDGIDLITYFKSNLDLLTSRDIVGILFSIIYSIACVQKHDVGFRHNDLTGYNIFVCRTLRIPKNYIYSVDSKYYRISNQGTMIKIFDFDLSSIDNHISNPRHLNTSDNGLSDKRYDYYDIHLLFNSLFTELKIADNIRISSEIRDFFTHVVPIELRGKYVDNKVKHGRLISQVEGQSAYKLLQHPIFNQLIINEEDVTDLDHCYNL